MQNIKAYFILLLLSVTFSCVVGQDLSIVQYTEQDGLPSRKTYDMGQDSTGLLWIGTENGLVSFDGDEFVTYTHPDLLDNDIIEIAINRNGRVYFLNLSEQLGYIENGKMVFIDTEGKFGLIKNIVTRHDKDFLIAIGKNWKTIYEIREVENNEIDFVATDLYFIGENADCDFSKVVSNKFVRNSDSTIFISDSSYLGFIYSEMETYVFDSRYAHYIVYPINENLFEYIKKGSYQRIVKDSENFFIIKNKGLDYYNSKTESFLPFFMDLTVNSIFFDSENNAWVSTQNQGLLRVSIFYQKTNFNSSNPKFSKGINDILQDENGIIYLGTTSSELIINDSNKFKEIKISDNSRPIFLIDRKNEIIAHNLFTTLIKNKHTSLYEKYNNPSYNQRALLVEDPKVYVGTSHGLVVKNIDEYLVSNYKDYAPSKLNRISSFYKHPETNIKYVGTIKGLFTIESDTLVIAKNIKLQSANISKITKGSNNTLWLGTRTEGVLNIRNDSILKIFDINNGLISNNINNLHQYKNELFVCTNSGLTIINLSSNKTRILNTYNFLSSNEVLVCKIINDQYWIGTKDGLTILTKEEINDLSTKGPNLTLKGFFINGVDTSYHSGMVLTHTDNNVQIDLLNISFKSGNNKKIKYRIPLIDTSWITTSDPKLRLPSLQPGHYHIEAIGVNSVGQQSESLKLYFKIDIPWWETIWARFLGLITIFLIGYFILRTRSKRIRKEEALKRDYLSQINKIKDQALQLQMNPHFIFNSLNAIQGFIGTDEEEKAMNFLARFARLIRLIFEHSKGNTISLEEELEFIHLYLDLERLRFKDKVKVEVNIDPEIDSNKDLIYVPPLLIQPIVENSFKHGLFHKNDQGHLNISYTLEGKLLKVIVKDNGIGREMAGKISDKNFKKHTSSGIRTTQERLDLLNFGSEVKNNKILIEDLYNEDKSPAGTKTTLLLQITDEE